MLIFVHQEASETTSLLQGSKSYQAQTPSVVIVGEDDTPVSARRKKPRESPGNK